MTNSNTIKLSDLPWPLRIVLAPVALLFFLAYGLIIIVYLFVAFMWAVIGLITGTVKVTYNKAPTEKSFKVERKT